MAAGPEAGMTLKGDPRDAAFRILRRFGYRRVFNRPVLLMLGWLVFAAGIGLFVQAILSRTADADWQIAAGGVMVVVCAAGLGLVAIGRRKTWMEGPSGRVLRFDGGRRLLVFDELDGRALGEWRLPELPAAESPSVLSPEVYAKTVRDLHRLLATAGGDDPLRDLAPEAAGAIRGWVLLGELAARLRDLGYSDWRRGARVPRPVLLGVFGGLALAGLLSVLDTARAPVYALSYAILSAASLLGHRAWGRGLRCGPLRISDRIEDATWIVTIESSGEVIEERLVAEEVLDTDLDVRDPTPLDDLAANAIGLVGDHSSRMITDSPGRASASPR